MDHQTILALNASQLLLIVYQFPITSFMAQKYAATLVLTVSLRISLLKLVCYATTIVKHVQQTQRIVYLAVLRQPGMLFIWTVISVYSNARKVFMRILPQNNVRIVPMDVRNAMDQI